MNILRHQNRHERRASYRANPKSSNQSFYQLLQREQKTFGVCWEIRANYQSESRALWFKVKTSFKREANVSLDLNTIVFAATEEVEGRSFRPTEHDKFPKSNMFLVPLNHQSHAHAHSPQSATSSKYVKLCLMCPATTIEVRRQLLEKLPESTVEHVEAFAREERVNHSFCKHTPMLWKLLAQGKLN